MKKDEISPATYLQTAMLAATYAKAANVPTAMAFVRGERERNGDALQQMPEAKRLQVQQQYDMTLRVLTAVMNLQHALKKIDEDLGTRDAIYQAAMLTAR